MKKIATILMMLCMLALLSGCSINWERTRSNVRTFVLENCETLSADVQQCNFEKSAALDGIEDIHPDDEGFVEYSCGGAGFGSATAYVGFYYSENDDMTRIWCASEPLIEHGDGYLYQEEDGDNRYYTEHIIGHFYYYEATY